MTYDDKCIEFSKLCGAGKLELAKKLIRDNPEIDPSARYNIAILQASLCGKFNVVEYLLQDPRVDQTTSNNAVIRYAAKYGQLNLVNYLLQNPRVDPTAGYHSAISMAFTYNKQKVLDRLLKDPRVNVHEMLRPDLSKQTIKKLNLDLPFPANSKIGHMESFIRCHRREFVDIINERTVYNNTDTTGIHNDIWKYIVCKYLE